MISLGVGGGLWIGPTRDAAETRSQALKSYIEANDLYVEKSQVHLLNADQELQYYQQWSMATLGSGVLLSGLGVLILKLAPSTRSNQKRTKKTITPKDLKHLPNQKELDQTFKQFKSTY